MLLRFISKPIEIEAIQWRGPEHKLPMVTESRITDDQTVGGYGYLFYITTIHGQRAYLESGDWIIKEPDGIHYYLCKPEIFERRYEPILLPR